AVSRPPILYAGTHRDDGPRRGIAGSKWKLPVRQLGVLEPLVCASPNGQLGAGADRTPSRGHQDLIRRRRWYFNLSNLDFEWFDDSGLPCIHGRPRLGYDEIGNRVPSTIS